MTIETLPIVEFLEVVGWVIGFAAVANFIVLHSYKTFLRDPDMRSNELHQKAKNNARIVSMFILLCLFALVLFLYWAIV